MMGPFHQVLSISVLAFILLDAYFLLVHSYTYVGANLKVRDTKIVDKMYEGCTNFRTFVLSENKTILVGCKNRLLQMDFNLNVIDDLEFDRCYPPSTAITCEQEKRNTEYYCQNYIRTIIELSDDPNGKYFVCGTNALRPLCYYVTQDFKRDPRNPVNVRCEVDEEDISQGLYSGKEIGAFNPDQNISSILISTDSGERMLFTATSFNSLENLPMLRRSNMSNLNDETKVIIDKSHDKWLEKPQFVGSPIEFGDRIYFFFRERAQELVNAVRSVFPRVAAVCKNDLGGEPASNLDGMWTTYVKARLNCSLKGEYPFYYNHLQDVYQSPSTPHIVYAVFTTQEYGQAGSALCTYNLKEIEKMINEGDFKGQANPNSLWLPYSQTGRSIIPRQGSCSGVQPEANYEDMRMYSLVDSPVPNDANYRQDKPPSLTRLSDNPLLVQKDVRFLQLVVKENVSNYDIFYIGTNHGTLVKFFMPIKGGEGILSQEINLKILEPVLTMELWQEWIFIGSENAIQRVPLDHCDAYKTEFQQCLTKDPYCVDPSATCNVTLNEVIGPKDVTANQGDVIYQFCHATAEEGVKLNIQWFKDYDSLTGDEDFNFKSYEQFLQGEIIYDYQHGVKIEHEVRSFLRVFVNSKTTGEYRCIIYDNDVSSPYDVFSGTVIMNDLAVTTASYNLRKAEEQRLKKYSEDVKTQFIESQTCTISSSELCDDVTGQEIEKGFTDSNPYIGMNKVTDT